MEDSVITAVPPMALVELVIVMEVLFVVLAAVVRGCAFSAGCDVRLLSGTCLEKNIRAVSSPATLILGLCVHP